MSLLEILDLIENLTGRKVERTFEPWRLGDQRYYVSDARKAQRLLGWRPRVSVRSGMQRLHDWLLRERVGDLRREHLRLAARSIPARALANAAAR